MLKLCSFNPPASYTTHAKLFSEHASICRMTNISSRLSVIIRIGKYNIHTEVSSGIPTKCITYPRLHDHIGVRFAIQTAYRKQLRLRPETLRSDYYKGGDVVPPWSPHACVVAKPQAGYVIRVVGMHHLKLQCEYYIKIRREAVNLLMITESLELVFAILQSFVWAV